MTDCSVLQDVGYPGEKSQLEVECCADVEQDHTAVHLYQEAEGGEDS